MKAIIVLALATGMRLGELLSLRREDVDLERGIIHVRNRGAFCTKNRRSRMVPMNRTARRILELEPRRSPYVFTSRRGDRLSVNWISKRFRAVARKAGLPESLHFHSLRHAAASWLIEEGAPLTHIREILGHSSIAVTTVYAHTIERALSQSIALVDPLLSETAAVAPVHPGEPVPGSLLGQKVDR